MFGRSRPSPPPVPTSAPLVTQHVQVVIQGKRRNSAAAASLIFGVLGILTIIIPVIPWVLAIIGISFAALGFLVGLTRGGTGVILSIARALLCLIPLSPLFVVGGALVAISQGQGRQSTAPGVEKPHPTPPASTPKESPPTEKPPATEPVAQPDAKPDLLTLANYYRVEDGMTYEQVRAILGDASEEVSSSSLGQGTEFAVKTVMLAWKGDWGKNAMITFQNGRVAMKAQFGLPPGTAAPAKSEPAPASQNQPAPAKRKEVVRATPPPPASRVWTDVSGRTTTAEFRGATGTNVKLRKADGAEFVVPLERLSDADKAWIKERAR